MSNFVGVVVDQWLHSQFTQVELRSLKSKVSLILFKFVSKFDLKISFDGYF